MLLTCFYIKFILYQIFKSWLMNQSFSRTELLSLISEGRIIMINNVTIVPANVDDAANMIDYLNQIGGESDNLLFGRNEIQITIEEEKAFIERMNHSSNSLILVGKENGRIVSIGTLTGKGRKRIAHRAEVALSVSKDYWGLGIGRKVLEELIAFAKNNKEITVIELTVKADNEGAIHLYEKVGFKKIGFFEKYFKIEDKYYDAYLMNLYLEEVR